MINDNQPTGHMINDNQPTGHMINDNQPTGHMQLSIGQGTLIDTHTCNNHTASVYSMHVCVPYRVEPVVTLSSVGGCDSSGQLQNGLHVI